MRSFDNKSRCWPYWYASGFSYKPGRYLEVETEFFPSGRTGYYHVLKHGGAFDSTFRTVESRVSLEAGPYSAVMGALASMTHPFRRAIVPCFFCGDRKGPIHELALWDCSEVAYFCRTCGVDNTTTDEDGETRTLYDSMKRLHCLGGLSECTDDECEMCAEFLSAGSFEKSTGVLLTDPGRGRYSMHAGYALEFARNGGWSEGRYGGQFGLHFYGHWDGEGEGIGRWVPKFHFGCIRPACTSCARTCRNETCAVCIESLKSGSFPPSCGEPFERSFGRTFYTALWFARVGARVLTMYPPQWPERMYGCPPNELFGGWRSE